LLNRLDVDRLHHRHAVDLQGDSRLRRSDAVDPLHPHDIDVQLILIEVVGIHAQDHRHLDVGADSRTLEVAARVTLAAALDPIAGAVATIHEVVAEVMILEAGVEAIREAFREADAEWSLMSL